MSEGDKIAPASPIPRPRHLKPSTDETDTTSKVYENFQLPKSVYDELNAQLSDLKTENVQRPVPTPRARTNMGKSRNYENSPETATRLNNQNELSSPTSKTGAIRKAPNIPSVKNNLDETETVQDAKDFDILSQTSSTSGKSSGDSKFTTPSPRQDI
jgi:hypothetical protein